MVSDVFQFLCSFQVRKDCEYTQLGNKVFGVLIFAKIVLFWGFFTVLTTGPVLIIDVLWVVIAQNLLLCMMLGYINLYISVCVLTPKCFLLQFAAFNFCLLFSFP